MPTPSYTPPSEIRAGDTLAFKVSAPDTPADGGWTGGAKLFGPSAIGATVTPEGADFLVTFAATDTGQLEIGDYRFAVYASKAGERYTISEGAIRVNLNPATVAKDAGLDHDQKVLALVRSALEGRITSDHESYSIGGRSISKIPVAELRRIEVAYSARVRARQNRGKPRSNLVAAFVPPR